jgi:hypothetical protein
MRVRVGSAVVAAVGWLLCFVQSAAAGPGDTVLYFSGTDLWRNGTFLYGGVVWSPWGLDHEGFALKAFASGGTYNYISGALGGMEVQGRELKAELMPGWRFKWDKTELKVFAGLDLQNHQLSPDDPGSKLRGNDVGLRVAFEFWTEPTPLTMFTANGSVSTIVNSYDARAAFGWRTFESFYTGPEIQAFATDDYSQQRIGLHITSLKLWNLEWSAAAGYAHDSDRRSSAYVRLGILTKR